MESIGEHLYESKFLRKAIFSFKIRSVRDLSKNLGELQAMAARLKSLSAAIYDDTIMSIMLNALLESFNLFKKSWNLFSINLNQKESEQIDFMFSGRDRKHETIW